MRKCLYNTLKHCIRSELLKTRSILNLTQEEMARWLIMSTRAYASLEGGKSCCGLFTFLLFLYHCCPDRLAFLENLFIRLHFPEMDVA